MTWHDTENSEDTTKILLELFNELGKIIGCKSNIQTSVAFLHTNNKLSEREIKETTPLIMQKKKTQQLGINPSKEEKDMHWKTIRHWERNQRRHI